MRVLYIAKHGSGGNDDEGAISHALEVLGHNVISVREQDAHSVDLSRTKADFMLCHHWHDMVSLRLVRCPKVFWCFDRIVDPDPSLESRNLTRSMWARQIQSACDIGFFTDGDWVAKETTTGSKDLHWLTQGADERVVGRGTPLSEAQPPILITASTFNGGDRRRRFISDFKERWGSFVRVVEKGVHGRAMANLIASAKIVVAPQHPSSDRYWSNRVYQALGFGAFLLHPVCKELYSHYIVDHLNCYDNDDKEYGLDWMINRYLSRDKVSRDKERHNYSEIVVRSTVANNLYRHRVERLLAIVKEKIG